MGFCTNCGAVIEEGSAFCSNCGTKAPDAVQQGTSAADMPTPATYTTDIPTPAPATYATDIPTPTPVTYTTDMPTPTPATYTIDMQNPAPAAYAGYYQPAKQNSSKTIVTVAVIVGALLVLMLIARFSGSFTSSGYERPLNNMISGMENGDFDQMMKAFPDYLTEQLNDQVLGLLGGDSSQLMDQILGGLTDLYGENLKMSYKVTGKTKLAEDEIADLEDEIYSNYGSEENIKEAYNLELDMTIKGAADEQTESTELTVIKLGSKWYLYEDSFLGF